MVNGLYIYIKDIRVDEYSEQKVMEDEYSQQTLKKDEYIRQMVHEEDSNA